MSFSLKSLRLISLASDKLSKPKSTSISTCGGNVKLFRGVPSSSFFLFENKMAINLLLSLTAAEVAGQRMVDSLSWSELYSYPKLRISLIQNTYR